MLLYMSPYEAPAAGVEDLFYFFDPCRALLSENRTNQNCIMFLKMMCRYTQLYYPRLSSMDCTDPNCQER